MKKILLALGTLTTATLPVVAIVSCGLSKKTSDETKKDEKLTKLEQDTLEKLKTKEESMIIASLAKTNPQELDSGKVTGILNKIKTAKNAEELLDIIFEMSKNSGELPKTVANDFAKVAAEADAKLKTQISGIEEKNVPKNNGAIPSTQTGQAVQPQGSENYIAKDSVGEQSKIITLSSESSKTLEAVIQKTVDSQKNFQITNAGTGKDFFKLPEKLILTGDKINAKIPNFKVPNGTSLEFFKQTGMQISSLSKDASLAVGSKDKIILMVKKNGNWVNGKSYTPLFTSVPKQFKSFKDGGFGDQIRNNTFDMDSITDFVNSKLLPGQTYTSTLAGQMTSMSMPILDKTLRPKDAKKGASGKRVYSPFIDASMAQTTFDGDKNTLDYVANKYESITMAFMQNGSTAPENASGAWGGSVALDSDDASSYFKIMSAMREAGHDFIVSFGGASGTTIWKKADPVLLAGFLVNFAEEYNINTFDYDIEGGEIADTKSIQTLSLATAIAQKALIKRGRTLNINLTIPSETGGLVQTGEDALKSFISSGVNVNILNGMAMMMNPGITKESGGLAGVYREHTIDGLASQLKKAYSESGLEISDEDSYGKIGITFDISTDTWEAEKMQTGNQLSDLLKTFKDKKIGFVGYWSLNNDDDAISGLGAPTFGAGNAYKYLHSFADGTGQIPQVLNQKTNEFTKKAFAEYYSGDIERSESTEGDVILPLGNKDAIPGGTKIKGINPDDGTVHIYQAKYWAESNQRPETPASPTQFADLGPVGAKVETTPAIKELLSQFSPFSIKGEESGGTDSLTDIFSSSSSSVVKAYDDTAIYNKPKTLVFYKGTFWINAYYADPGQLTHPTKYGPWHKAS